MVNTRTSDYDEAMVKAKDVIKKINEGYKCVEIDNDGLFANMLLLKKKKYAAMMVSRNSDGQLQYSRKTSGLDMVRRDWCPLSKEVSSYVLDRLLSSNSREDVLENIHTYLREKGENVTAGKDCRAANSGGPGGHPAPWPRDCIAFQPTYRCICMGSDGSYLPPAPLADRELSPQARSRGRASS
jgi:hypothetical protein